MIGTAIKVGFVLLSNSQAPLPSTRVAALNMFGFLRAAGYAPQIVYEPPQATPSPDLGDLATRLIADGFRIVCLQKVHGPGVVAFARALSSAGIKTVYIVCDLVDPQMVEATDATAVVSDYLKSLYPPALQPRIDVVHDGVERAAVCKTSWQQHRGSWRTPLRAVLVTSASLDALPVLDAPPPWLHITVVGRYPNGWDWSRLRRAQWEFRQKKGWSERMSFLRFHADPRVRCVPWDPEGVYRAMCEADIGIIPIDTRPPPTSQGAVPDWAVKSENRLTMKMAVGLPVVATPIPSYEPVIEQGRNGFLARRRSEWLDCLDALRDPAARRAIGARARVSALEHYSMEKQADRLVELLRRVDSPCVAR